ncbi:MAG: tRNA isopentenyl-2-thiomethyl-A-37 hydroxylase MiaE [Chromatocurvus sp.]
MSADSDARVVQDFLACATPAGWIHAASQPENLALLLIDHANCEKKAAATALALMQRYTSHHRLLNKLSRLAREELRHFEQVIAILHRRDIAYTGVSASRYASEMRERVRRNEPDRLVDTLLIGAIIEARSCERFAALAPYLDEELSAFYRSLLKSEARHFQDYLSLAEEASAGAPLADRLGELLAAEALLVQSTDTELRFHSGVPVVPVPAG